MLSRRRRYHAEDPSMIGDVVGGDPMISITDDAWEFHNPLVQVWEIGTREAGETARHGVTEITSVPKAGINAASNATANALREAGNTASEGGALIAVTILGLAYLWSQA